MQVEGLACGVVGVRPVFVTVVFSDEHPECRNGMPVALVRGCTVARDQGELEGLLCPGTVPVGVRLYVEPGTTPGEIAALWIAGFMVRLVRVEDLFSIPGWWHLAAHRDYRVQTRGLKSLPPPAGKFGGVA